MSEVTKQWYVLRAAGGREKKAKEYIENEVKRLKLQEYVSQVLIPTEDSIFRAELEQEEIARLSVKNKSAVLENLYMYPPLKGEIINRFDVNKKQFGIDIKVTANSIVTATLDGMIIFSGWTLNDNYVVQIQHSNNLISIYKGNSTTFKSTGERVNAGEAIATAGTANAAKDNYLHFEL